MNRFSRRSLISALPRAFAAGTVLMWLDAPPAPAAPMAPAAESSPDDSVVLIRTTSSLRSTRGSGFLIGDGSWVVTASHVVSVDLGEGKRLGDSLVLVYVPWTGRPYEAKVVALDSAADIALLRLTRGGFPALPVEGLELREADAALSALKERPLSLYGFPLTYGEETVASLAKPQRNDTRLREIAKRNTTNLSVLQPCPDAQPGWSGGPIVCRDRGTVVAVFHSRYFPKPNEAENYPAGSIAGYLGDLLRKAGTADLSAFSRPVAPTVPRSADAAELMALELRQIAGTTAGQWEKAEEAQREILRHVPDDALAHCELGRLLLIQKKYPEGLQELEVAIKLAPESPLIHLFLGKAYHLNSQTNQAMATLRRAMELSPDDAEPRIALAELYEETQKLDEAEALLRPTPERALQHPGILFRYGNLLLRREKQKEGVEALKKAAELAGADPALSGIPLAYGRVLEGNRKYREAESIYRSILRADTENAHAYYSLSLLYLRMNRVEDAQIQLNNGIRLPTLSDAMLEAFRQLQAAINERALRAPKK